MGTYMRKTILLLIVIVTAVSSVAYADSRTVTKTDKGGNVISKKTLPPRGKD